MNKVNNRNNIYIKKVYKNNNNNKYKHCIGMFHLLKHLCFFLYGFHCVLFCCCCRRYCCSPFNTLLYFTLCLCFLHSSGVHISFFFIQSCTFFLTFSFISFINNSYKLWTACTMYNKNVYKMIWNWKTMGKL